MGLFGFGKKKHQSKEALEAAAGENEEAVDAAENVDEAQEVVALPELPLNTRAAVTSMVRGMWKMRTFPTTTSTSIWDHIICRS